MVALIFCSIRWFCRLDWLEALDPVEDIQAQITVDLLGVIWVARAVVPHMLRQKSGHIINMCSMAGWAAPPLYTAYSAAKFGMRGFSEALRREVMPFGVKVSLIYPAALKQNSSSISDRMKPRNVLGRPNG